jgi:hypothetical protein
MILKSNPALLNEQFVLQWTINLTVSGECLAQSIIDNFIINFYPYNNGNQLYYQSGCGIILNNAQAYTTTALSILNEMKITIKELFSSNYNCYARQLSQNNVYGDIIIGKGRFYNEHGSECAFLLKQTLRPIIKLVDSEETSQEITTSNSSDTIKATDMVPSSTSTSFSNLFKKLNNKIMFEINRRTKGNLNESQK